MRAISSSRSNVPNSGVATILHATLNVDSGRQGFAPGPLSNRECRCEPVNA